MQVSIASANHPSTLKCIESAFIFEIFCAFNLDFKTQSSTNYYFLNVNVLYLKTHIINDMSINWRSFAIIFAAGIILFCIGAAIPLYPKAVIMDLEQKLSSGVLSQSQQWAQQGSLTWWRLALAQTYMPVSGAISIAGELTAAFSIVYSFLAVWFGLKQNKNEFIRRYFTGEHATEEISEKNRAELTIESPYIKTPENSLKIATKPEKMSDPILELEVENYFKVRNKRD